MHVLVVVDGLVQVALSVLVPGVGDAGVGAGAEVETMVGGGEMGGAEEEEADGGEKA